MPKEGIHPSYYPEARVTCACGNTFTVGSTVAEIRTDICSNCHPFYTGEQRIVDTAGQVDRFMKRLQAGSDRRTTPQPERKVRKPLIQTVGDDE
jgi:large subunit ribosomal protein L31